MRSKQTKQRYYFGIDITPYWFGPLGRTFGLSEKSIERRVKHVLRKDMSWHGGGWKSDARHTRRIFDEGEWGLTVSLTRSSAVLELGKRLVSQLDVADDFEHRGWPITSHSASRTPRSLLKMPRLPPLILVPKQFWKFGNTEVRCPTNFARWRDLEPALRALASLDVAQTEYRYYPEVLREAETGDADDGSQKWLKLARDLDYSARLLMHFALRSAAQNAASQAAPWVDLALQAGADVGPRVVVRFILDDDDASSTETGEASLRDKVSRLESFANLANSVATELRARLSSEGGPD